MSKGVALYCQNYTITCQKVLHCIAKITLSLVKLHTLTQISTTILGMDSKITFEKYFKYITGLQCVREKSGKLKFFQGEEFCFCLSVATLYNNIKLFKYLLLNFRYGK